MDSRVQASDSRSSVTQRPGAPPAVRLALIIVGILSLAVLGLIVVRAKQSQAKQADVAVQRAEVQRALTTRPPSIGIKPVSTEYTPKVEFTGTLRPWREADLGFETSGRLVKVGVNTGASVKQGQMLAILDARRSTDMLAIKDASTRAAAASVALAEDSTRRAESLAASKSIPESQVEQARQQLALARAQLQAAQADAQLARTGVGQHTLTAPFPGLITKAPSAEGSVVQPGSPLFRIEDLTRFRLSATLGEEDVALIHAGQVANVEHQGRTVTGKVSTLVPSLDPATRRAPVEIEVPNDKNAPLLGYGFVRVTIAGDEKATALRVPASAKRTGSQDELVRVIDGKAKIVHVVHTVDRDGSWLVRRGIDADSVIVDQPDPEIVDGEVLTHVQMR